LNGAAAGRGAAFAVVPMAACAIAAAIRLFVLPPRCAVCVPYPPGGGDDAMPRA